MHATISRAEREVQSALELVYGCAQPKTGSTLGAVESELWTALLTLGQAVLTLFLLRCAARQRPTTYEHAGMRYALDTGAKRRSEIGTRFGKVPFVRPIGRCLEGRCRADLPVDRELGLCSGFSLGTVTAVVRLCAMMAFGTARRTFAEFHEWAPSPRATLRMVDALGAEACGFLDARAVPADDGEVLVIQVDARGAPMISTTEHARRRAPRKPRQGTQRQARRTRRREHARPRRAKGDKSKNAKLAFVGVLYTLRATRHGWEGPINKRLIATFESHEALFRRLAEHVAARRGRDPKRMVFLADGSEHIWRLQQRYFPDAEVCIDWYHVVEKLWEAGGCFFHEASPELKSWIQYQKGQLRDGFTSTLLAELNDKWSAIPKTGPGNKGRRQRLGKIIGYLSHHQHRMRFREMRDDSLDIGTGVVEGAVRNLVALRLDGPGMRWSRDRAEMVLHLRCILLNEQWDEFRDYLASCQLRLAAQPVPTRTHDAKAQQLREAA
jgi:hypothetical protein